MSFLWNLFTDISWLKLSGQPRLLENKNEKLFLTKLNEIRINSNFRVNVARK